MSQAWNKKFISPKKHGRFSVKRLQFHHEMFRENCWTIMLIILINGQFAKTCSEVPNFAELASWCNLFVKWRTWSSPTSPPRNHRSAPVVVSPTAVAGRHLRPPVHRRSQPNLIFFWLWMTQYDSNLHELGSLKLDSPWTMVVGRLYCPFGKVYFRFGSLRFSSWWMGSKSPPPPKGSYPPVRTTRNIARPCLHQNVRPAVAEWIVNC